MKHFCRQCAVFAGIFFFVIQASFLSAGQEKITVYFYSSETNINNFKSLKMEFDGYLSRFGSYEFQPFSDQQTFESHIRDKTKSLILLSSWHYKKIYNELSLQALLVGVREGKSSQKRILVSSLKQSSSTPEIKGAIASASNIEHTRSVLTEMLGKAIPESDARILTVPKEVDALMSVGFQMSKYALITENAFKNLKQLDPVLHNKMNIIAEGKDSMLLILAAPSNFAGDADAAVSVIEKMQAEPSGINVIKMLDLDGWKKINMEDKTKLEG